MAWHAYLFEARSIQPFLFATGKLKDMVSGSEILDYLCEKPLDEALQAAGANPSDVTSPRRAGGAFYLLFQSEQTLTRFRNIWPLLVNQLLPGIEQVAAISSGNSAKDAIAEGMEKLRIARNRPQSHMPRPGPLAARSPRTGAVAVAMDQGEHIDQATAVKRSFKRPGTGLTGRFCQQEDLHWPINFEADARTRERFPLEDNRLVGLIHADGNGLGEVLRNLNIAAEGLDDDAYLSLYRQFSDGLTQATCKAAQQASEQVLVPQTTDARVVPARPLVLGGDDLTALTRADLALPFTRKFIEQFEQTTEELLTGLKKRLKEQGRKTQAGKLPPYLTACAGITFMKANQPFGQGYDLAEGLCKRAKNAARKKVTDSGIIPSTVSFYRIQAAMLDAEDVLFEQEMQVNRKDSLIDLGLAAYHLGQTPAELPKLKSLDSLALRFDEHGLNASRLRKLITLLYTDRAAAAKDYSRWRSQASESNRQQSLNRFDEALEALLGSVSDELPVSSAIADGERTYQSTPLGDLLSYLEVHQRNATEQSRSNHQEDASA